ncbi:RAB11-binding protein RELCH homolog isoform X1 [Tachypleus tridentatus]|uniref:RAB11-binding protein RELCH homolog isoform X1 n=1 Tax=Tachypleus tridentatus TaxID=6853 RepID=UPI003FCEE79D
MAEDGSSGPLEDYINKANSDSSVEIVSEPPEVRSSEESGEPSENAGISLDKLAAKLLKDNFILTALELHTELLESGRELPRLRDYFSNPGNFEKQLQVNSETSPVLPRTSSVQTFDSLDFARYSDDGERQVDERVAILEFELRKAKETIKGLRANLTVATESDPNTPEGNGEFPVTDEPVKPHEKRALNFLVNEYLMKNSYKLTSITFSDENEDQDFEDWDDVGLNIPKPPELLSLYKNYCKYSGLGRNTCSSGIQTETADLKETEEKHFPEIELEEKHEKLRELVKRLNEENDHLMLQVKSLQREVECHNNLKSSTPLITPVQTPKKLNWVSQVSCDMTQSMEDNTQMDVVSVPEDETSDFTRFPAGSDDHLHEATLSLEVGEPTELQERLNDLNASETIVVNPQVDVSNIHGIRKVSEAFCRALMSSALGHKISQENRLINEVAEVVDSCEKVVLMLGRCLPHIVPNVILAKREELIPVILCTIGLHPSARDRDKLLNILFNLIKRPDEEQRHMILAGFVAIAKHLGPTRVESELLPQCWEQLAHKYPERRLLVAESCGVLASYVPPEICSSLLLSMLQQMLCDDKEEVVREAAARSLAILLVHISDRDKFVQVTELLLHTMEDSGSSVVEVSLSVLLPSVAVWGLEQSRLESDFIPTLMRGLEEQLKALSNMRNEESPTQVDEQPLMRALHASLPFLFVSVVQSGPFTEKLQEYCQMGDIEVDRLPVASSPLLDPLFIAGDKEKFLLQVKAFDQYIGEEWFRSWDSFDWTVKSFLPSLMKLVSLVDSHCQSLVHSIVETMQQLCHLFGRNFTQTKVKPVFCSILNLSQEDVERNLQLRSSVLTDATVPVFACGVLNAFHQDEDRNELVTFLQEVICTMSICNAPLISIQAAIIEFCSNTNYHDLLLSVLWDVVVHTSALVRSGAARLFEVLAGAVSEQLLRSRVIPALITLASDPEISVRAASVPAFGSILMVTSRKDLLDKVHLQLQTFLDDPVYRDQHVLEIELIHTFARVGPNIEPRFRDDFVLPRLASLAAKNNQSQNETKRQTIASALLEAYTALSCCFMSEQIVSEVFLPGLRCLCYDLQQVAPQQEDVISSMIREFEARIDMPRMDESSTGINIPGSSVTVSEVRNKVTKIFATRPLAPKSNISNLFHRHK